MKKTVVRVALLLFLLHVPLARAGDMERHRGMGGGPPGGPPAFLEDVFPPTLIMRNQAAIGLTAAQQEAITRAMTETQAKLVPLQWKSEGESEKLAQLLRQDTVDEQAALAQSARVLAVEQEIKQVHLALLIRIKNELTPAQQQQLRDLRKRSPGPPPPAPPM
jgi:Spy/CpxP family protein refolding chaperone